MDLSDLFGDLFGDSSGVIDDSGGDQLATIGTGELPNASGDLAPDTSVGNSGWTVNSDGTYTAPDGTVYNQDGTPAAPGAPGSGANSPSNTAATPTGSGLMNSIASTLGISPSLLASLLPMLAAVGAGAYSANQTKAATNQVVQGITNAQNQVSGILGPGAGQTAGGGNYQPYINTGQQALGKLGSFNYQPLAPQFGNLATGGVNAIPNASKLTLGSLTGAK